MKWLILSYFVYIAGCSSLNHTRVMSSKEDHLTRKIASMECFHAEHQIRTQPIDIFSTIDLSSCKLEELKVAEKVILDYLATRVALLDEAIQNENGVEQFRLQTEINASKISLLTIREQVKILNTP